MRHRTLSFTVLCLLLVSLGLLPGQAALAQTSAPSVAFAPIGTYATGLGELSGETAAVDRNLLIVTNSANNSLDFVDTTSAAAPTLIRRIDLSPYGAGPNSVAVRSNLVAVAVEASPKTSPGKVLLFDRSGRFLNQFTVGALPDMLTFSPDGHLLLVANEGEPSDDYAIDPEGSVSILPIWQGARSMPQANISTATFHKFEKGAECEKDLDPATRIFGPSANRDTNPRAVSQNLEPEYITFSPDGRFAYVTLQENNAVGVLDLSLGEFVKVVSLGTKDYSLPGSGLDASDRDGTINIATWPVRGMYMPDAIAAYRAGAKTYLVTANEGDARDYPALREETTVGTASYTLDPTAFPNAAALKANAALGRLAVTRASGDTDGDGDYDVITAFGARSFSIWSDAGALVWDSGDQFEQFLATNYPANFNANNTGNAFDNRSDNKGPEPEGVAVGSIAGRTYAFIGLERMGGVMIYDITTPSAPRFIQYTNNRDFSTAAGPDSGPEVIIFVPGARSPSGKPRFLVANEVSGTVTIYEQIDPNGAGTLSLLHNNDGESSLLPISYPGNLPVGSAAAYRTLVDQQISQARAARNATLNVYAGDSFLASSTLACSLPPNPTTTPVYDAVAQRQIPYDAHIFGNHEFDFAPDFLERFIRTFRTNGVLQQPFLSANLNFSGEPGYADLIDADGLIIGSSSDGRVVSRSLISVDKLTGQRFGIVAATTPLLPTISSPRNVTITPDLASTAVVVQAEIDRLRSQHGITKIIFVSHLQDVNNDRAFIPLLRGVDIAVAGGGDELLASPSIPDSQELLPGESQSVAGTYPLPVTDADGRTVYIVTTAGNYKYLGRIDATFDQRGEITSINAATSYPRRVIPASPQAAALGLADAVAPNAGIVSSVEAPLSACLAALANPIAQTEVLLNVARGTVGGAPGVRTAETNAGNLIADSFVASYDRYAAANGLPARSASNLVIGVQNGGGIRQNAGNILPTSGVAPGTITRRNTLDVLAFLTNTMTVVNGVTAVELKEILERSAAVPGGGQFLQVSGIRVTYDYSQPAQQVSAPPSGEQAGSIVVPGSRVREVVFTNGTASAADDITLVTGGAVVAGAPSVRIVTNSFTAIGGDNFPTFEDAGGARLVQLPATYEQAWVEYLLAFPASGGLPTVPASDTRYAPGGEGRITILP